MFTVKSYIPLSTLCVNEKKQYYSLDNPVIETPLYTENKEQLLKIDLDKYNVDNCLYTLLRNNTDEKNILLNLKSDPTIPLIEYSDDSYYLSLTNIKYLYKSIHGFYLNYYYTDKGNLKPHDIEISMFVSVDGSIKKLYISKKNDQGIYICRHCFEHKKREGNLDLNNLTLEFPDKTETLVGKIDDISNVYIHNSRSSTKRMLKYETFEDILLYIEKLKSKSYDYNCIHNLNSLHSDILSSK